MSAFAVYSLVSGEVLRSGSCPDADIAAQANGAEVAVATDGTVSRDTHYFSGSELLPYTGEQSAAKAQRPPHVASWSNAAMVWVD